MSTKKIYTTCIYEKTYRWYRVKANNAKEAEKIAEFMFLNGETCSADSPDYIVDKALEDATFTEEELKDIPLVEPSEVLVNILNSERR